MTKDKIFPNPNGTNINSAIGWTDVVTDGANTYTVSNDSQNNWRYFALLLEKGVKYTFYQTERSFDTSFWLYNSEKSAITSMDSDSPSQPNGDGKIDNDGQNEKFYYTPSDTNVFYLRWGSYSNATGNATIQITPSPLVYSMLTPIITPTTGINKLGIPYEYSSLKNAGIIQNVDTNDEFCRLYIDFNHNIIDSAKGNKIPIELSYSNIDVSNGYGLFNGSSTISCSAQNWDINQNFTLEFYINFDQLPTSNNWSSCQTLFVTFNVHDSTYQHALRFGNTIINFQYEDNSWIVTAPMEMEIEKWYHFALVRENTTYRIFIDGKLKGEGIYNSALSNYSNAQIGYESVGAHFIGKLINLNLSIGIARYTEDFHPIKINGIYPS